MQVVQSFQHPVVQGPWRGGELRSYNSEQAALLTEDCNDSVHFLYLDRLRAAATQFVEGFRGTSMYAVKANPSDAILLEAWRAGVRAFDVASLREVEAVHSLLPAATLYFMHPVKSRQAIRRAYALGVRAFAFDTLDELEKLRSETSGGADLQLFLRTEVQTGGAAWSLKGKFGAPQASAPALLKAAKSMGARVGVSFHVGSQCMDPKAFRQAIEQMASVTAMAGIKPDVIDVGGGFPVPYPGMQTLPLDAYFAEIHSALDDNGFSATELLCEPGRALVAEAGAVAVRVELRKDGALYLNDGTYGALFDAGVPAWPFAVRLVRLAGDAPSNQMSDFTAFGPTCDSCDKMAGPFSLPADAREGDWIVFENLGSYGQTMQSRFNGFYSETCVNIMPAGQSESASWQPTEAAVISEATSAIAAVRKEQADQADKLASKSEAVAARSLDEQAFSQPVIASVLKIASPQARIDTARLVSEFAIATTCDSALEDAQNTFLNHAVKPEQLRIKSQRKNFIKLQVSQIDETTAAAIRKALKGGSKVCDVQLEHIYC